MQNVNTEDPLKNTIKHIYIYLCVLRLKYNIIIIIKISIIGLNLK